MLKLTTERYEASHPWIRCTGLASPHQLHSGSAARINPKTGYPYNL